MQIITLVNTYIVERQFSHQDFQLISGYAVRFRETTLYLYILVSCRD